MEREYLRLQQSEVAVVDAASRILSAFIISGRATEENMSECLNQSVDLAVRLARKTDHRVLAEGETG